MNEKIDNGKIIKVKNFNLSKSETIRTISTKSYRNMYFLFKDIFNKIKKRKKNLIK